MKKRTMRAGIILGCLLFCCALQAPARVVVGLYTNTESSFYVWRTNPSGGFDTPGANRGDIIVNTNGISVLWSNGVFATSSANVTDGASNFVSVYQGAGNTSVISVVQAPGGGGAVTEVYGPASAAYFPFTDGWLSANMDTNTVKNGNTNGVTIGKLDAGYYYLNGLGDAGRLFVFSLGNGESNVVSAGWNAASNNWEVKIKDDGETFQDAKWSWLFVPNSARTVCCGTLYQDSGTISNANDALAALGYTVTKGATGYSTIKLGNGSVVNPTNYALFVVPANQDNLMSWEPAGDSFQVHSIDLPPPYCTRRGNSFSGRAVRCEHCDL